MYSTCIAYGFNKLFGTYVDLDWETSGPAACKIIWFLMQFDETLSSWLMATLSADYVFALFFPLRHRSVNVKKLTRWILLGVTVAALLMAAPSWCFTENAALIGYTIKHCIPNLSGNSWIVMVSFMLLSILNIYFVPEAVYATCTLLIVFKLQSLRANGNNLSIRDSIRPATRPEQKERSAAITIVFLLVSDIVVYTPLTFFFSTYCIIQVSNPNSLLVQAFFLTLTYYSII